VVTHEALNDRPFVAKEWEWQDDAACKGLTDLFFPDPGVNCDHAKAICAMCPVRVECAEAGATEDFGIWGGLSPKQRRPVRVHGVNGYNQGCRCDTCITAKRAVNSARNRKKTPMDITYTVVSVGRHLLDTTMLGCPKSWIAADTIRVTALSDNGLSIDTYETTIDTQPPIGFTYTKVDAAA
jgi:WhiB family redox-sensing transcriptional regulator